MAFKLDKPNFHNSDQSKERVDEVIQSINLLQKPLDDGVVAEANNDGSMYVDDDIDLYTCSEYIDKPNMDYEHFENDKIKIVNINNDNLKHSFNEKKTGTSNTYNNNFLNKVNT